MDWGRMGQSPLGRGQAASLSAECPGHTNQVWQLMKLIQGADSSRQCLREMVARILAFFIVVCQGATKLAKARTGIY